MSSPTAPKTKPVNYMEPRFSQISPEGLMDDPIFTFDEFINVRTEIDVYRYYSNSYESDKSTILEAAKSMRQQRNLKYTFSLSANDELNPLFHLPSCVKIIDLYTNFSPIKQTSSYLRTQSKLFHGYHKNYQSPPYQAYGGMSQWLQLVSGELELKLFRPTEINLTKLFSWDLDETFVGEAGTQKTYTLKSRNFIFIPSRWIVITKAKRASFAFGGEFLHHKTIDEQLRCFDRNISESFGRYASDRDREIRFVYWILAAKILSSLKGEKDFLLSLNFQDIVTLRNTLTEWKKKHDSATTDPINLYAPSGIQISLIRRDLTWHLNQRMEAKSLRQKKTLPLKSPKSTVDVSMEQRTSND